MKALKFAVSEALKYGTMKEGKEEIQKLGSLLM